MRPSEASKSERARISLVGALCFLGGILFATVVLLQERNAALDRATTKGALSREASVMNIHNKNTLIENLRLEVATVTIEMMQEDTKKAAEESVLVDVGPFCDVIDKALDLIGVRGVYQDLFDMLPYLEAFQEAARLKEMSKLRVDYFHSKTHHQPRAIYKGIPNDREWKTSPFDGTVCTGCLWWLFHWTGAITADKLTRDGSLLLEYESGRRLNDALSFVKELHRIEKDDSGYVDLMPFHSIHGFIWQYVANVIPDLDTYPMDLAMSFCGDLEKHDPVDSINFKYVHTNSYNECWHGFGHAIYVMLAARQLGLDKISCRTQIRPQAGFELKDEYFCEGYKICDGAPDMTKTPYDECIGAFDHSARLFGNETNAKKVRKHISQQEKRCKEQASTRS